MALYCNSVVERMECVRRLRHLKFSKARLVHCASPNGRSIFAPLVISKFRKICPESRGSAGIPCLGGEGTRLAVYQEQRSSIVTNATNHSKSERENKQKKHWWRADEAKWIGAAIGAASAGTVAFSKLELSGVVPVEDIENLFEIMFPL